MILLPLDDTQKSQQDAPSSNYEPAPIRNENSTANAKENSKSSGGLSFDSFANSAQGAFNSVRGAVSNATRAQTTENEKPAKVKRSPMQAYMSKDGLWTWLKKEDRRQLFDIEDRQPLSEDEYMGFVSTKLTENGVPATIVKRKIRWDESSIVKDMYVVAPNTSAVNPISCILQFAQVGHFSFVEQKTFLAPPNLPAVPGIKKEVAATDRAKVSYLMAGVLMALVGLMAIRLLAAASFVLIIVGLLLAYLGFTAWQRVRDIEEYNRQCDRDEELYNQAWKDWEDTVFLHSFQEATNGQVTRIYQAVSECIRQVNEEQFRDIKPAAIQEDTTMAELEQQITRRKESYR